MRWGADPRDVGHRRWTPKPALILVIRAVLVALPLAAGAGAGALVASMLPPADGAAQVGGWALVLAAAMLATIGADRLARRLLPLTALLRLTLTFPDRAPSRLRVAMRATNVRSLQTRIQSPEHATLPNSERVADIVAFAAALNSHDRRTRGHSERVQAITQLVAEQMHLQGPELDQLLWAAFLHDIGKLEVPSTILNKPGPPDDDEWRVLRSHPDAGARLTTPLRSWLGDAAGAIDEHHERFDGTGYPRGLSGDEISRAGRIVAVTDAFETITAARAYKGPTTAAEGRAELTRCAGTHFDPQVVRAFLDVSLGRLRWAIGIGAFFAMFPIFGAARARAATMRPALSSAGGGMVGAVVASMVLATAPLQFQPPAAAGARPGGIVLGPSGSVTRPEPGLTVDEPKTPEEAPASAGSTPPDPSLARFQIEVAGRRVVARVLGGVEVTSAPDGGTGVEASAPLLGPFEL